MTRLRLLDRHRGVSLVISLIILVILTLVVLSGVTMSTSNVKSTANMQFRDEALAAANVAIEQVVSTDFVSAPQASTITVDINQDGTLDYSVDVPTPVCTWWTNVSLAELDASNPSDIACFGGTRRGGIGPGSGDSFCANTEWSVRALVAATNIGTVVNKATGAAVTVNQGIGVRMNKQLAEAACQ